MSRSGIHRIVVIAATLLTMFAAPFALAVTFNVNSTLDQPDDLTIPGTCHTAAGTCTLRAAVMQANRAASNANVLIPPGTYVLTIPPAGADDETSGDLDITGGAAVIYITGAGQGVTIIDGNHSDRAFHIHSGRQVFFYGMTVRNGAVPSFGGGILNDGNLTVENTVITGNQAIGGAGIANFVIGASLYLQFGTTITQNSATGVGGGIYNSAYLSLNDSTISQNQAASGGGIAQTGGSAYLYRSTISGNIVTGDGGGISSNGSLIVIDSTISQNSANSNGGGVVNTGSGTANFYNATIAFNTADADADVIGGSGGGIFNYDLAGAVVNVRNTLVAGNNIQNAPVYDDCTGTVHSFGRNLFWGGGCTIINGAGGSWTTLSALNTLGPLQNNGGGTLTHALLPGSNAIDGGDPANGCISDVTTLTIDQRGAPRVAGVRCDIGAFEFGAPSQAVLLSIKSRKVHGAAGTYDVALASLVPTTEPRSGPSHTIVFTYDKPLNAAMPLLLEGAATVTAPTFSGNDVIVGLSGVSNQQYVKFDLFGVSAADGGTGESASVRIGFLVGDVNQNRVVTVADLGLINAQLAQTVNATNYLKDVNATGTLTVADKGIANANLAKALPPP